MSRGGFRGRGRGGGGPGANFVVPNHSDMNKMQWQEALREAPKHTGMLFPPLDPKSVAHLPAPIVLEDGIIENTAGLYKLLETGSMHVGHTADTPWRIVGERKTVGIEIETWSGIHSTTSAPKASSSKLDPATLYLDQSLFPPALWKEVFEGDDGTSGAKRKKSARDAARRKRRLDLDGDSEGDDDEERSRVGSESEQDDDFDFEEEEEDHQDYDANYFDNGEGDDDDEGGEEDGDGGGYDE